MLFSASTSDSLNRLSASSLNTALPPTHVAGLASSAVASGLIDPLQQSMLTASSEASDSAIAAGILSTTIVPSGVPDWNFPIIPAFSTLGGGTLTVATTMTQWDGSQSLYGLTGTSVSTPYPLNISVIGGIATLVGVGDPDRLVGAGGTDRLVGTGDPDRLVGTGDSDRLHSPSHTGTIAQSIKAQYFSNKAK